MEVKQREAVNHLGNLKPIEEWDMTVNTDDLARIIEPLTQQYKKGRLAGIREISTNAWDSHQAAGISDPIEVFLPSPLKPVFIVRDHGVGLSRDEVRNVYTVYGLSTKTRTNNEVGMFGFGSKAPLAYADQFTVIAVKDGEKIAVLIPKGANGVGKPKILFHEKTNECNGVEVQIPVRAPIEEFNEEARDYYKSWDPGTVLVNGEIPDSYFDPAYQTRMKILPLDEPEKGCTHDLLIVPKGMDHDLIIMGNVPYATRIGHDLRGGAKVIARVEIGKVEPTPNREALLEDEDDFRQCRAAIIQEVQSRLQIRAQEQVNMQPDMKSAIVECVRWKDIIYNWKKTLLWNGQSIPQSLEITGQSWTVHVSWGRNQATSQSYIRTEDLVEDGTYVLLHHPATSMRQETKDKIKADYPKAKKVYIIWSIKQEHKPWLAAANVIDWNAIKPPKLVGGPRATRPSKYEDGGGRWLVHKEGIKFSTEDIAKSDPSVLIYLLKTDQTQYTTRDQLRKELGEYCQGQTTGYNNPHKLILLATGEVERFVKLHPHAVHFDAYFQQRVDGITGKLTQDQLGWGDREFWLQADTVKNAVDDPAVKQLIRRMDLASSAVDAYKELLFVLNNCRRLTNGALMVNGRNSYELSDIRTDACKGLNAAIEKFHKEYPLCGTRSQASASDMVEYMNALYNYRKV